MGESADFPHELQCCGADFLIRRRRLEIEQRANAAAHGGTPDVVGFVGLG
jgi:hypothetical protein